MNNFWKNLPQPFLVQAPMEHVTDTVFRRIIAKAGAPDVYFTEFTSVEGLLSKGGKDVARRLVFTEKERPLVAQIWGKTPEKYKKATEMIVEMGFDGVDINMGCPDRTVVRNGCCSALINNHPLAAEIVQAVKEGAAGKIPVSVKTRIGFNDIRIEEWLGFLLEQDITTLSVHLRTVKEKSLVPAHWDLMSEVVKLRNQISPTTILVGNGDVESWREAKDKTTQYGFEGIMIGRGIFHNLWVFNREVNKENISKEQRLQFLKEHIQLYDEIYHGTKDFNLMKKFYKVYVSDWENASDLRMQLMQFNNAKDTLEYLETIKEVSRDSR